jgi:hypothetical protein
MRVGCARLLWCIQNSIWKVESPYSNFASLMGQSLDSGFPNAILSFNWDLLAERALTEAGVPWSYSVEDKSKIAILKPHGSINWSGYLRDSLRAEYGGWRPISKSNKLSFDVSDPLSNSDKQDVNSGLRYMIFPGDPDSAEDDADLKLIWSEIENAIEERDNLAFIGYSLPQYDTFALNFLKRAATGKSLTAFNPSDSDLSRFRDAFGDDIKLTHEKFEHCPYAQLH